MAGGQLDARRRRRVTSPSGSTSCIRTIESRATLNLALPYMRPDGLYVIEDWGWAHWPGDVWQKGKAIPLAATAGSSRRCREP